MSNENQTPEQQQARALESMLAQAVLNKLSEIAKVVVNNFESTIDLQYNKSRNTTCNGVDFSNHKLATIEQFNNTLRPCVEDEAKVRGWNAVHFCQLKIDRGNDERRATFVLQMFGERNGELINATIEPVKILEYANS